MLLNRVPVYVKQGKIFPYLDPPLEIKLKLLIEIMLSRFLTGNQYLVKYKKRKLPKYNKAKLFYVVTPLELHRMAFEFAVKNSMKHNFNLDNKIADKDRLYLF